jgi:pimeloyl-ACP methyl ester carboxylesterase
MPTFRLPSAPDLSIFYDDRGAGDPVVLLNGMSQSTANWMTQARAMRSRHRVICYDARGQGRSSLGPTPLTLDGHVDDLIALLDHLGLATATLCGFSHGARVAVAAAALRPERVDRLVITALGTNEDPLRRAIVRSWYEILQRGGTEAMAWAALPDILGRSFLAAHEDQLDAMVRATTQRNTDEGLVALIDALRGYPSPVEEARRVTAPVLLISGLEDQLVDPHAARSLARCFRLCRHVEVPDCGHTVPIEHPDHWRAVVLDFLAHS